jgi:hypothetical protein
MGTGGSHTQATVPFDICVDSLFVLVVPFLIALWVYLGFMAKVSDADYTGLWHEAQGITLRADSRSWLRSCEIIAEGKLKTSIVAVPEEFAAFDFLRWAYLAHNIEFKIDNFEDINDIGDSVTLCSLEQIVCWLHSVKKPSTEFIALVDQYSKQRRKEAQWNGEIFADKLELSPWPYEWKRVECDNILLPETARCDATLQRIKAHDRSVVSQLKPVSPASPGTGGHATEKKDVIS